MNDLLKYLMTILSCVQLTFSTALYSQTLDYLYDASFTPENVIGGNGSSVSTILEHVDGRITIAGGFQFNWPLLITKAVRFQNDGSLDESFSFQPNPVAVNYIQFHNEGYLFNNTGYLYFFQFDGSSNSIDEAQFLDYCWNPFVPETWPGPDVGWIQIMDDNKIMVAGRFSPDTTDLEDRRHLVRVMPDGSPDTSFEPLKCHEPYGARIIDLYPTPNGKWMIAGEFMDIEGYESPGIARLNEDFSVDTTFQSPFPDHTWTVRIVRGAHPQDLSGAIDDEGRVYVIHKDSTTGFNYSTNTRLLPNGEVDTTFSTPEMERYFVSGNSAPGLIFSIVFEPDGSLIVGGSFRKMDDHTRNCIAKLNEDGSLIENVFNRMGADTANWQNGENPDIDMPGVHTIVRLDNGGLMVGGSFSRYDGHEQWGVVRLLPSAVGVKELADSAIRLTCFPNPASESVRVEIPGEWQNKIGTVKLYNATGQQVLASSQHLGRFKDIGVRGLPNGLYLLSIQSGPNHAFSKIVVE